MDLRGWVPPAQSQGSASPPLASQAAAKGLLKRSKGPREVAKQNSAGDSGGAGVWGRGGFGGQGGRALDETDCPRPLPLPNISQ